MKVLSYLKNIVSDLIGREVGFEPNTLTAPKALLIKFVSII